mgnify:CR=1 FL=1
MTYLVFSFKSGVGSAPVEPFTLKRVIANPESPSGAGQMFGLTTSSQGDIVAIGAPAYGAVAQEGRVYTYDVTTGQLLNTFQGTAGADVQASFGYSISLTPSYLVVGSPSAPEGTDNSSGRTYIFNKTTGELLHTLTDPNIYGTTYNDAFANNFVSVFGNYAVIGALGEQSSTGDNDSGVVHVFDMVTGNKVRTIENPNVFGTPGGDSFGTSVFATADKIYVGAPSEETGLGKIYAFDFSTGTLLHTFDDPNPYTGNAFDYFGYVPVAVFENYLLATSPVEYSSDGQANNGRLYVFDTTTWALVQTIDNPNDYGAKSDQFGMCISVSATHVAVGAVAEDDPSGISAGKVYIYGP